MFGGVSFQPKQCHKKVKNLWLGDASGGDLCRLKVDKNSGTRLGSRDQLQNELQSALGLQCDHIGVPFLVLSVS
jgi:hypothetical protein